MPHARRQREKFYRSENGAIKESARFVHYTTAEAALNIIRTKRVWMRNTKCMVDYRELQHGFEMLQRFFSDPARQREFYEALNSVSPSVAEEAIGLFNKWWQNIEFNTFIASISEHDDKEDSHGRLSMWRAFGGNTARVAMVFAIPWFSSASEALNFMFGPVAYLQEDQVHAVFAEVTRNIRAEHGFLASIERSHLVGTVFNTLAAAISLKHEGFHEEREWRVIYTPDRLSSPFMESSIEIVSGIPQTVYKLPLDAKVSELLADLDLACIFDRLIIGPSQFAWAVYEAFAKELTAIGVAQPERRLYVSGIPIRP